jgi:hypothetical protein
MVASFDSATVLHAANAAALRGRAFPHLGHGSVAGAAVRLGGRLPWPLLRRVYTRFGASEGIRPDRLGDVDNRVVAQALADAYPQRRYPAVMVGSSNGALAHLAAAMQVPWLPDTTLLPVRRRGDPDRPVDAMRFGEQVASPLLERNPDVTLHHMHDQVQDELMVARMTYFRLKWRRLPDAYADALSAYLQPGAPVLLVQDGSTWPVTRINERHVFQTGAQGGRLAQDYLDDPHTPVPDDTVPEAEWGADPGFADSLEHWCAQHGHPLVRIAYTGPQAPAHPVATVMREWYRSRGEPADRLLVPSFILGDPWTAINTATVPFWSFFAVQPSLDALEAHLAASDPYRTVDILLFQHGVHSSGIAEPEQWEATVRRHGGQSRLVGLDPARFPHDIASLGRYGPVLQDVPRARHAWSPLPLRTALDGLERAGLPAR